jgi:hypothetical protein
LYKGCVICAMSENNPEIDSENSFDGPGADYVGIPVHQPVGSLSEGGQRVGPAAEAGHRTLTSASGRLADNTPEAGAGTSNDRA